MTTPPQSPARRSGTWSRILAMLGVLVLALAVTGILAGAAAVRSFRAPTDLVHLRAELLDHLDVEVLSRVEVVAPVWAAALGRLGARVGDVEPEVQAALHTVHQAQIGVYQLATVPERQHMLDLLVLADARVEPRNWHRIVTVLDHDQLVAIYGSSPHHSADALIDCLIVVLDQRNLIVVSARADAEPLLRLASSKLGHRRLQHAPPGLARMQGKVDNLGLFKSQFVD